MSVTAEAPAPAKQPTKRRPSLEALEAQVAELAQEEQEIMQWLADADHQEAQLRIDEFRETGKPGGATSKLGQFLRRRSDAERRLDAVRKNKAAANEVLRETRERLGRETQQLVNARVRERQDAVAEAIRACAEAVEAFCAHYATYRERTVDLSEYRCSAEAITAFGSDLDRWQYQEANLVLEPVMGDVEAAFRMLYAVMADPAGAGYRSVRSAQGERPLDYHDRLRHLTREIDPCPVIGTLPGVTVERTRSLEDNSRGQWGRDWNASLGS